jgi:dinuclear metal center YbgI/SA1388 family protein
MTAVLGALVQSADETLLIREIEDYPNALNGLQIENDGSVTKIGAAVDASVRTIEAAVAERIDFLIVHHGIFWPGLRPIIGTTRDLLRLAFTSNLALYSAHIPLDVHPEFGNNALLMRALRIENAVPFFPWKNTLLGQRADVALTREELLGRLRDIALEPKSVDAGPDEIRSLGVITGGAGGEIFDVAKLGIDTFITGETPHWAAVAATDLKINLIAAGHYATETFGVRALAEHLAAEFNVPHKFINAPSGF